MYKEYFKEIFQHNKTVIIPGLGSITKPNPSENIIVFNPFLKFNDGFFIGFISKKQGIGMDEAGKQVNDNVARINEALDKQGEAIIVGLGTLKKNADGKLEFISNLDISESAAGKAVPPVKVTEVKQEEAKQPEVKIAEPIKEEPKIEIPNVIPPVAPVVSEIKVEETKLPDEKMAVPPVVEVKPEPKKKESIKKEKPVNEKKEGAKKKFPIVLVLVILILGGAGTFAALKWDMVKGWVGMGGEKTEETKKEVAEVKKEETAAEPEAVIDTVAVADTAVAEATVTEEIIEEPVEEPVKEQPVKETPVNNNVVSTSGNFHVIVNCYTVEQNATKMVESLTAKGHAAHNLGQRGGYFMVSAGSFSSREEAVSKLGQIRSEFPKAWLYEGL